LHDDIFPLVSQDEYIDIQEKVYGYWKGEGKGDKSNSVLLELGSTNETRSKGPDTDYRQIQEQPADATYPSNSGISITSDIYDAICWCLAKLWTDKGFEKQVGKRFPTAVGDVIKMRKKGKRLARKEK